MAANHTISGYKPEPRPVDRGDGRHDGSAQEREESAHRADIGSMTRKDTRKRVGDRHKPGYQREWMRRYRAKLKAQSYLSPKPLKP